MKTTILIVFTIISGALAYSSGAPPTACDSMYPSHDDSLAQTDESPYVLTYVKEGNSVSVTLSAVDGDYFVGFMIQARNSNNQREGTFTTLDEQAHIMTCSGGDFNSVTHNDKTQKTSVTVKWEPTSSNDVNFTATVVRQKVTFWTGQKLFYKGAASEVQISTVLLLTLLALQRLC